MEDLVVRFVAVDTGEVEVLPLRRVEVGLDPLLHCDAMVTERRMGCWVGLGWVGLGGEAEREGYSTNTQRLGAPHTSAVHSGEGSGALSLPLFSPTSWLA